MYENFDFNIMSHDYEFIKFIYTDMEHKYKECMISTNEWEEWALKEGLMQGDNDYYERHAPDIPITQHWEFNSFQEYYYNAHDKDVKENILKFYFEHENKQYETNPRLA